MNDQVAAANLRDAIDHVRDASLGLIAAAGSLRRAAQRCEHYAEPILEQVLELGAASDIVKPAEQVLRDILADLNVVIERDILADLNEKQS